MKFDEIRKKVVLCDGAVESIAINREKWYEKKKTAIPDSVIVTLRVRLRDEDKKETKGETILRLTFTGNIEYWFYDDTGKCSPYYSDITFVRKKKGRYYLSLNPYDNTGKPHDRDHDVVIADEVNGELDEVNGKLYWPIDAFLT